MNSTHELTVGHLYIVKLGSPGFHFPEGLLPDTHVQLIYHKENWCLVKTWQGKVYSVPEESLSIQ